MAIGTYAQLQAAIAGWLDRIDLTARIPDFIALAEARLNRVGLLRSMEAETSLSTTTGLDYVALPTGFISPIAAWIEISSSIRTPLGQRLPEEFGGIAVNSIPRFFAIDALNVLFDCPAAAVYTIPFRYLKSFALSDNNPTNYLLDKAPDAYLFASLAEAEPYMMNDARVALWENKAQRAIKEQNNVEARSRNVPLRTEFGGSRSNIFTG